MSEDIINLLAIRWPTRGVGMLGIKLAVIHLAEILLGLAQNSNKLMSV